MLYNVWFNINRSVPYNEDTLGQAEELQRKIDADYAGTEILQPLKHIYKTPPIPGYNRQVGISHHLIQKALVFSWIIILWHVWSSPCMRFSNYWIGKDLMLSRSGVLSITTYYRWCTVWYIGCLASWMVFTGDPTSLASDNIVAHQTLTAVIIHARAIIKLSQLERTFFGCTISFGYFNKTEIYGTLEKNIIRFDNPRFLAVFSWCIVQFSFLIWTNYMIPQWNTMTLKPQYPILEVSWTII